MKQNQTEELQLLPVSFLPVDKRCLEDVIEYPQKREKKKENKKIITYYLN